MNVRGPSLVCVLSLAAALGMAFAADSPQPDPSQADQLVKQLGSPRFAEREAAVKALEALGADALPALRRAAESEDAEVRRRAGELIAQYERNAESAAAFAPTKVHLQADGTPLADVVRDLAKQARVRLQLAREPAELAVRPVTLDTGETSFWEALDALCRQAKVSIRSSAFDPSGSVNDEVNDPLAQLPQQLQQVQQQLQQQLAGMVIGAAPSVAQTNEALVLQDGAPPAYPTAYLGAVRVRLVPDLWANRARGPDDEHRWTLEVLSEPRLSWQGTPMVQFDLTTGLTVHSRPAGGAPNAPAGGAWQVVPAGPIRVNVGGAGGARRAGPDDASTPRSVTRHELPVTLKADAQTGPKVPEVRGTLAGNVQLAAQMIAAVADVHKLDEATAVAKDGTKLTVRDCREGDNGLVTLKVEVERPGAGGGGGGVANVVVNRQIQVGGAIPGNVVEMVGPLNAAGETLQLFDTQGRPYTVSVTGTSTSRRNGVSTETYTLQCRPAGADSQPGKLELHGPRRVSIEARFTLRDVPRP